MDQTFYTWFCDSAHINAGVGIGRGSADFRWKNKMSTPPPKIKWSAEKKFRKKMQGCFMQFLRLIFVKKLQLQGALLPDPTRSVAPWTSTGGRRRPPGPHFSADFSTWYRLGGLVVRRPPRERKTPGSNPACGGIFSGSSHTSDFKICTPVATLPGAWHYRISAGTGRPGVSIL